MIENTMAKSLSRADRVKESIIDLEFAFWVQDKGEIEIASTIWLSMMNNRRVELTKDDGTKELIPLFEAYESNADGEIVLRKNVKWSKADDATKPIQSAKQCIQKLEEHRVTMLK